VREPTLSAGSTFDPHNAAANIVSRAAEICPALAFKEEGLGASERVLIGIDDPTIASAALRASCFQTLREGFTHWRGLRWQKKGGMSQLHFN
jgi:hypothetical protein